MILQACALLARDVKVTMPRGRDVVSDPSVARLAAVASAAYIAAGNYEPVAARLRPVVTALAEYWHQTHQRSGGGKSAPRNAARVLRMFFMPGCGAGVGPAN
jgi:hypothetical protein